MRSSNVRSEAGHRPVKPFTTVVKAKAHPPSSLNGPPSRRSELPIKYAGPVIESMFSYPPGTSASGGHSGESPDQTSPSVQAGHAGPPLKGGQTLGK